LKKFLRINECIKSELDKKMAGKFSEQYLRQDGIFVLRLVGKNANDVLVSELILQLWNHYRNKPLFKHVNQVTEDNSNVWLAVVKVCRMLTLQHLYITEMTEDTAFGLTDSDQLVPSNPPHEPIGHPNGILPSHQVIRQPNGRLSKEAETAV
jgi:hypothetical protein